MAAIGCMLPVMLLLVGAVLGGITGGAADSMWGGAIGLLVGLAAMVIVFNLFSRARSNWPP